MPNLPLLNAIDSDSARSNNPTRDAENLSRICFDKRRQITDTLNDKTQKHFKLNGVITYIEKKRESNEMEQ